MSHSNSSSISFAQAVKVSIAKFGLGKTADDLRWGDAEILEGRDLSKLTRAHLKRHLGARSESIKGNRAILVQRLSESLEKERNLKLQIAAETEAKHRKIADLEEEGAVYCVGSNCRGQLGLGDLDNRSLFTVIPETRGLGIKFVATKNDIVFAVTETKEVYTWGGGGVGPMATDCRSQRAKFESPQIVQHLEDEDILEVSIGSNHACAVSENGDVYAWGEGRNSCLGNGELKNQIIPDLVPMFTEKISVKTNRAGEMHNCTLARNGEVYSFGYAANGRLGLGRFGKNDKINFSKPHKIHFPFNEKIRLISCGAEHAVAVGHSRIFSWGSGDGGRLGHGDYLDRWEPSEILSLKGQLIVDISCGTWHSACIIAIPPMRRDRGWLYTWGSGLNGQLAQNDVTISMKPNIVPFFCAEHVVLQKVYCGSHHNAVITCEGEMYTWGSNLNKCLGREIEEQFVSFTSTPGYCPGFGAIVDRIGRGLPKCVALGRGYTIVCTKEYLGPTETAANALMINYQRREREKKHSGELKAMKKLKKLANANKKKDQNDEIFFLTSNRLCTLCEEAGHKCTGFQVHASKPSICKECGHSSVYHTIKA